MSTVCDAAADALVESYVAWREASSDVHAAYERWAACDSYDREGTFAGYLAALQQEEHAAWVYELQIEEVRRSSRPRTDVGEAIA
jgi:hypothetical protein